MSHIKAATVYEYNERLYVHSLSRTTAGVFIVNTPVLVVPKEKVRELGRAIKECLAASRDGVSHPTTFSNLFDPILEAASVKSYGTFAKRAKCLEISSTNDATVTLTPTRNLGVRDGFSDLTDKVEAILGSDEALGAAAVAAMAVSE